MKSGARQRLGRMIPTARMASSPKSIRSAAGICSTPPSQRWSKEIQSFWDGLHYARTTRPYLGRSSWYPEGVRENGMYCHGVQWLVGAARILSRHVKGKGDIDGARDYAETAYRLWRKISPLAHVTPGEIEIYGGQPNKQAADLVTALDPGRMGWHGYTGAAGWMLRQSLEGVCGLRMEHNETACSIKARQSFVLTGSAGVSPPLLQRR